MKPVKMHEAKTNFSRLIGLVEAGEEIVVQRNDRPVAKIVPYPADPRAREAGALKGRIKIAEDFDMIPEGFEEYLG
jgi:prevent-host-death family protein